MTTKLPPIVPLIRKIDRLIAEARETQAIAEAAIKRLKELAEGKVTK